LPIKLRIQADIQLRAPGLFNRKSLSIFLHRHTTSTPYLKALVASPTRHDLDGTAAGEVAQEHRDAAAVEVQRRRAIVEERIAAERAARRGPRPQRPPPGPASHAARPAEGPERPEHPGQAEQPARRSPHPAGERNARFARPGRPTAGGRPASAPGASPAQQPRQPHHQPQHQPQHRPQHRPHHQPQHQPQHQPRPERTGSEGEALLPMPDLPPAELAARRERALLLRQFESSPLTRANFCALKRIGEAELDAQLALARQEAAPRKRG
jgi:ProP effector